MPVLDGLTVLDLTEGSAGAVATMLLADHGADVVKVERPGGDPFRATAAYTVWNRSKRSVVLDLRDPVDRPRLDALAATADVIVDSLAPRAAAELAYDTAGLRAANPRLVTCSITGYGRDSEWRDRPGWDLLVQATSGMQWEQIGNRPGPIFLHSPLPSMGAALLAVSGITAALVERGQSGAGQHVDTSLMQGALLWMTQIWTRASHPTPQLERMWGDRAPGPTPNFEAGDGKWFHPMPMAIPLACEHVGHDLGGTDGFAAMFGDADAKWARHRAIQELYRLRPMQEWVDLMQAHMEPVQPVLPVEEGLRHFQVEHNRAATDVEYPGVGTVRQVGEVVHLSEHRLRPPVAPVPAGHDTDAVLGAISTGIAGNGGATSAVVSEESQPVRRGPLAGVRVLDFPLALAGPFATMILGDMGADVIGVHNLAWGPGSEVDITYAAGHRGKRSIAIDMKHPEGRAVAQDLIRHADVVHNNMRTGVSDRLGFGPADVHALNPRAISSHLTSYGSSGPLGDWPGVDQMGQALSGLEYELGGTREGGQPNWYRYGMCDATSGMLAVVGIVEALLDRERTGRGQDVESCILDAGVLLSSDGFDGPDSLPRRPSSDARQTGLGPRYRLYETAHDWLAVVAPDDEVWSALCRELGVAADAPVDTIEQVFLTATADEWFARLDARGVPCEVSRETRGWTWFDDADAHASAWVVDYPHAVWGRLWQPGRFVGFSRTAITPDTAPPLVGEHTVEILEEIGYPRERIDALIAAGAVGQAPR